jgi:hypothetical protein
VAPCVDRGLVERAQPVGTSREKAHGDT